jgi:hypothetical protein
LFETEGGKLLGAAFDRSLTIAMARKGRFVEQGMAVVFRADAEGVRTFRRSPASNWSLYSVDTEVEFYWEMRL